MANVIDIFLATDGTEFRVVQRTAPTTGHTLYDVIDSNGTTYLDLPIENYTRARITAIFEQRSYNGKLEAARIDAAVTIEELEKTNVL